MARSVGSRLIVRDLLLKDFGQEAVAKDLLLGLVKLARRRTGQTLALRTAVPCESDAADGERLHGGISAFDAAADLDVFLVLVVDRGVPGFAMFLHGSRLSFLRSGPPVFCFIAVPYANDRRA